uniref:Uncharacterized protein n=1 Tax=Tanacetum cinerariifolium TaxID=118510 RepID=A0A6L2MYW3_TANCI|nr:hypothetical protein [Tanacetum cinerariifolium]
MSTPKFAETHNLVAFLEKPTEFKGFEQIIDFLISHPIKYALTISLTIYSSCSEHFWVTAKVKHANEEAYAKVDGKRVVISEASSGVILDLEIKELEELANHTRIYVSPSHTKKVFANIKRQGKDFSGRVTPLFPTMIVQAQQEMDERTEIPTDTRQTPTIIQPTTSQPQRKQKTKKPRRKDTKLPQTSVTIEVVAHEAVYEEMYDSVERTVTTATGFDSEQDRGIISKTQFTETLNEPSSIGTSSGSKPRRLETMGDAAAQTRFERVSKFSNDPPLLRFNTLRSGEDRLKLDELMELYTQLQSRVLALETTKTNQALEIGGLKRMVKKLEKKTNKRTHKLSRLYKIGVLDDEEVIAEKEVSTVDPVTTAGEVVTTVGVKVSDAAATPTISMDDSTLAKALATLKSKKPMGSKDKGKAKMIEPEKPLKKKDQIMIDEEVARNLEAQLQAELEEEERLARQKEEKANMALIAEWDDVQAMMDADHELAERLQAEEQGELTIAGRAEGSSKRAGEELESDKSKKQMLDEEVEVEEDNDQEEAEMKMYMNKSFEEVQKAFENIMSWINLFVPMEKARAEGSETRVEGISKRAGEELESEKSKKQKLDGHVEVEEDNDQEDAEMKMYTKIISDDEIAIDAIHLATKPPIIVDWKIINKGKISSYHLIRADGSSNRYSSMI